MSSEHQIAFMSRGNNVLNSLLHLDQLLTRITTLTGDIALYYNRAESTILKADREIIIEKLRDSIDILEETAEEHRKSAREINLQDIVALYGVAGLTNEEALQEVEDDFESVSAMVEKMRRCARDALADVVYEGIETPSTGSDISLLED